ncbi:hypothetical protein [Mycoplasma suis]|uniref:Uncharacterized protein n=1 Tax=Mycoplasma suis (strain Illinois) TaxID=768700 RepID=F0QRK6_MYCSL|nr:hypothetical protein [Mycoplasma suis]ADX98126.1 hypothetical protein MSU_0594 [Mycoplasma suis str. Illinois]
MTLLTKVLIGILTISSSAVAAGTYLKVNYFSRHEEKSKDFYGKEVYQGFYEQLTGIDL